MAVELYDGEHEVKRVKERNVGWVDEETILVNRDTGSHDVIRTPRRDLPVGPGQRWVLDRGSDAHDLKPLDHEWVLLEQTTTSSQEGD